MNASGLRAPFPWYGGKSRVAAEVWRRFGAPDIYVEPFAGSLAVLLARPSHDGTSRETVNDADAFVTNFWRGARSHPIQALRAAMEPLNQIDMQSRHTRLQERKAELAAKLISDPDYCDVQLAGWWLHGVCCSFGEAWLQPKYRQKPAQYRLGAVRRPAEVAREWMRQIAQRLAAVRICHGDWLATLTPIEIGQRERKRRTAAILLDPPYAGVAIKYGAGAKGLSAKVREWAIEAGRDVNLRIALCGYEGEHEMPEDWRPFAWASSGGLASYRAQRTANRFRERIWFSPGCLA